MRALVTRLDAVRSELGAVRHLLEAEALPRLDRLSAGSEQADARLGALEAGLAQLDVHVEQELRPLLRILVAEEGENQRRLQALRDSPGYAAAWDAPEPLVSVTIATRDRPELLITRALPSVLGQSYTNLEVVVVGDASSPETAEAVRAVDDPRLRWSTLTQRTQAHADPRRHWLVGSTLARNEATRLARGNWLLHFDDDDALRPDAVEQLLAHARVTRAEVAYGAFCQHRPDSGTNEVGAFPPTPGHYGWQGAIHHAGLPFQRELVAAYLGVPGDIWLLERMLRSGVRFAMLDSVVWDYFPSTLWEA
jgi:hypothetical protein